MNSFHLNPVWLRGSRVQLVPLALEHCAALSEATRDGELWKLWYTSVPEPEAMEVEIRRRLALHAAGSMLPFTVLDATGEAAGGDWIDLVRTARAANRP
jgi:hypothetical protein